jgi:uncharacterized protein
VSASALYEGTIRHRRFAERPTAFTHRIALAYLDLDELPHLLGGRLVRRRPGIVRFRRADYLGDPKTPLADAVRELVHERTGTRPEGAVRVLTQLRTLGHCFNPVSFYYCFDAQERLEALVAEVTNTPWGDRHAYVLTADGGAVRADHVAKALHVSPFFGMDQTYAVRAAAPGRTLSVQIESSEDGERAFDATLGLHRRALSPRTLAEVTARAATLRGVLLIYGHALGLWLHGVRVRPRPEVTPA